jgi:hypothetical protein
MLDENPLAFVEGGNSLIRVAFIISLSYILGFTFQTLIFPLVADKMKKYMNEHPPKRITKIEELKKQVIRILKSKLPAREKEEWFVPYNDLRSFCKLYVLEHSPALGRILLEKEDDINFMAAHLVAGPVLMFAWLYSHHYNRTTLSIAGLLALVFAFALGKRLYAYLQTEIVYAYEAFLILQLGQSDQQSEKDDLNKQLGKDKSIQSLLPSASVQLIESNLKSTENSR